MVTYVDTPENSAFPQLDEGGLYHQYQGDANGLGRRECTSDI
jgi:hypothetical protein